MQLIVNNQRRNDRCNTALDLESARQQRGRVINLSMPINSVLSYCTRQKGVEQINDLICEDIMHPGGSIVLSVQVFRRELGIRITIFKLAGCDTSLKRRTVMSTNGEANRLPLEPSTGDNELESE